MKAEIVIASYNGGKRLGKTMESLAKMSQSMTLAQDEWRVLVVNNNSTDDTKDIALSFKGRLPIEVIDVQEPGKSVALNKATSHYKADLIVFSDDDVEVYPDWLDHLVNAADSQKEYDVFAGRIIGHWEKRLDPELEKHIPVGSTYALHDLDQSGPCDPGIVWGPNMAIRRKVFDEGHRYNETIGPQPKKLYPMGQDSEMAKRLFAAGHKSYFVADAIVKHTVKEATVSEDWIIRRAERLGYGIFAVKGNHVGFERKSALPLPVELLITRLFWTVMYPFTTFMGTKRKFWSRWKYYFYRGLLKSYQEFGHG